MISNRETTIPVSTGNLIIEGKGRVLLLSPYFQLAHDLAVINTKINVMNGCPRVFFVIKKGQAMGYIPLFLGSKLK